MLHSSKFLILRDFDVFKSLNDNQIEQLSNQVIYEKYKKGSYLFNVGDPMSNVYILVKGSVKVGLNTSNDKVMIKEIAYKNEFVGENVMPGHTERRLFAHAVTDTEAFKIPTSYFKALLERNPNLCHELTQILIGKMASLEQRMNNFVFKKAQSRIVDFLKDLAKNNGMRIGMDEILVNHGLSHKEIANITDTSRQTVARVLGDLKRQNIIHFSARKPHKILIRNVMNLC
ncbi:MAG: Crp/Fnr family transcriptional regulator [Saprospiraceae bacterium]|nr:Crp/Fnr family transcriptional regulator [Bacteroidia bacterium]NNE15646.1 Crp/Fnr family transcriptional regulator [Saprospiraceae bacterium]NNL92396.1 Crp/Fnr family transcriptional regulator [Saprospiraceae bacterium]